MGRTTATSYDAAGNAISVVAPDASITSYGYDETNRLLSTTYSDGVTPGLTIVYDQLGRRTR